VFYEKIYDIHCKLWKYVEMKSISDVFDKNYRTFIVSYVLFASLYLYTLHFIILQGINSSSLCSLAGWYDNPIPTRFLAPIDFLTIPAQATQPGAIGSLESILGLL
jgi:hypothetical protein